MHEYAIKVKVQNNYLLTMMRAAGYESALQLSKATGVPSTTVGLLLNLKKSGLNKREQWRRPLEKIAEHLRCLPEDLIPAQHHRSPLARNTGELTASAEDVAQLFYADSPELPDAEIERKQRDALLMHAMSSLNAREERVLRELFGFNGEKKTLEQVADNFGITRERIRQIEMKALRKLKHPKLSKGLREASSIYSGMDAEMPKRHMPSIEFDDERPPQPHHYDTGEPMACPEETRHVARLVKHTSRPPPPSYSLRDAHAELWEVWHRTLLGWMDDVACRYQGWGAIEDYNVKVCRINCLYNPGYTASVLDGSHNIWEMRAVA